MTNQLPQRTYYFSDTYGGQEEWNPLAIPDADVLVSTDFGSRPHERIHREFDIFGQEAVTNHMLHLILAQHDELMQRADLTENEKVAAQNGGTAVFINTAPRTANNNADPFYVATARGGNVRIVTTPLDALSPIKQHIETLSYLPNPPPGKSNGLYNGREQFRSRLTPKLLDPNHKLHLNKVNPSVIPDFRKDWHVSYVDRFGNVITRVEDVDAQWEEIINVAGTVSRQRDRLQLLLGEGSHAHPTGPMEIATSLGEATPGVTSMYRNGGIDVVVKWVPNQSAVERLSASAWNSLGKPKIGTPIRLLKRT